MGTENRRFLFGTAYNLLDFDSHPSSRREQKNKIFPFDQIVNRVDKLHAKIAGKVKVSASSTREERFALWTSPEVRLIPGRDNLSLTGLPILVEHSGPPVGEVYNSATSGKNIQVIAEVWDPKAISEIDNGNLKAFSIGYRVLASGGGDISRHLDELSLVHEPFFDDCVVSVAATNKNQNIVENKKYDTYNLSDSNKRVTPVAMQQEQAINNETAPSPSSGEQQGQGNNTSSPPPGYVPLSDTAIVLQSLKQEKATTSALSEEVAQLKKAQAELAAQLKKSNEEKESLVKLRKEELKTKLNKTLQDGFGWDTESFQEDLKSKFPDEEIEYLMEQMTAETSPTPANSIINKLMGELVSLRSSTMTTTQNNNSTPTATGVSAPQQQQKPEASSSPAVGKGGVPSIYKRSHEAISGGNQSGGDQKRVKFSSNTPPPASSSSSSKQVPSNMSTGGNLPSSFSSNVQRQLAEVKASMGSVDSGTGGVQDYMAKRLEFLETLYDLNSAQKLSVGTKNFSKILQ